METLDNNLKSETKQLSFNSTLQGHLRSMATWAMLLTVALSIVLLVFVIMGAYVLWLSSEMIDSIFTAPAKTMLNSVGAIYLVFGLLLIIPNVFLIRYFVNVKRAFDTIDQGDLEFAIQNARNVFVFFAFYVFIWIIGIAILYFLISNARAGF